MYAFLKYDDDEGIVLETWNRTESNCIYGSVWFSVIVSMVRFGFKFPWTTKNGLVYTFHENHMNPNHEHPYIPNEVSDYRES